MYNRNEVIQALHKVNDINITVTTKAGHKTKLEEMRQLYYDLMSINKYLFDPQYCNGFCWYKQSIQCGDMKKILDNRLNYCIVELKGKLCKILETIDTCQWDKNKQKYIEIA